jgi:hypothetical protein
VESGNWFEFRIFRTRLKCRTTLTRRKSPRGILFSGINAFPALFRQQGNIWNLKRNFGDGLLQTVRFLFFMDMTPGGP